MGVVNWWSYVILIVWVQFFETQCIRPTTHHQLGRKYFWCIHKLWNKSYCYCVRLDETGEVVQIHYSTRFRDSFCRQSLENVEPLYKALKTFSTLLYDPHNVVEIQLKTGTNFTDNSSAWFESSVYLVYRYFICHRHTANICLLPV